jgi:pyrroline-5-carboxylate reductase
MLKAGVVPANRLVLSHRSAVATPLPGVAYTTDNQSLVDRSDVVILSVRPQDWPAVSVDAGGKLVVSLMAGIRLEQIVGRLGSSRVVRALLNAAAGVSASYTPWFAAPDVTPDDRVVVDAMFRSCGAADEVPTEREIDYFTGMSGAGPAYPALLAAAMIADAVARGVDVDRALRAATMVMIGAGRLMEAGRETPDETVQAFLNYRGTTAAAIEAMRAGGFDRAVAAGLAAAMTKAIAMGAE